MPISLGFERLKERIAPLPTEVDQYQSHLTTVRRRITTVYPRARVQEMGSRARGTAIRRDSDLDLLVRLNRGDVRWGGRFVDSRTALNTMRKELRSRYVQTDIGRDGCAVVARFGNGRFAVDIVPGFFERMVDIPAVNGKRPVYMIPDGMGGWMKTSPEAHNQWLAARDRSSRGQLKFLSRIMKFWCHRRASTKAILGFHVELLIAAEGICVGARPYDECVADALTLLAERHLAAIRDPVGISGLVPATRTSAQRDRVLQSLHPAAERARKAVDADRRGKAHDAYRFWNIVFNHQFPKT